MRRLILAPCLLISTLAFSQSAKDLTQKFAEAAKQNMNVLLETKDAWNEVFENSLKTAKTKAAAAAKKAA